MQNADSFFESFLSLKLSQAQKALDYLEVIESIVIRLISLAGWIIILIKVVEGL